MSHTWVISKAIAERKRKASIIPNHNKLSSVVVVDMWSIPLFLGEKQEHFGNQLSSLLCRESSLPPRSCTFPRRHCISFSTNYRRCHQLTETRTRSYSLGVAIFWTPGPYSLIKPEIGERVYDSKCLIILLAAAWKEDSFGYSAYKSVNTRMHFYVHVLKKAVLRPTVHFTPSNLQGFAGVKK